MSYQCSLECFFLGTNCFPPLWPSGSHPNRGVPGEGFAYGLCRTHKIDSCMQHHQSCPVACSSSRGCSRRSVSISSSSGSLPSSCGSSQAAFTLPAKAADEERVAINPTTSREHVASTFPPSVQSLIAADRNCPASPNDPIKLKTVTAHFLCASGLSKACGSQTWIEDLSVRLNRARKPVVCTTSKKHCATLRGRLGSMICDALLGAPSCLRSFFSRACWRMKAAMLSPCEAGPTPVAFRRDRGVLSRADNRLVGLHEKYTPLAAEVAAARLPMRPLIFDEHLACTLMLSAQSDAAEERRAAARETCVSTEDTAWLHFPLFLAVFCSFWQASMVASRIVPIDPNRPIACHTSIVHRAMTA
mmetsp:Transcript_82273/g.241530  ORF Transcript_82273/g.241530 Transcript_82273/m.241530 type:complete len:360 (-) Transcript_82273:341-1420(-)